MSARRLHRGESRGAIRVECDQRDVSLRDAAHQIHTAPLHEGSIVDLHGLPDDWFQRYAAGIRKVTANSVRAVARSVAPANKLVISVVGDMTKVRADIDKLGFGEPAMFDLYGIAISKPAR